MSGREKFKKIKPIIVMLSFLFSLFPKAILNMKLKRIQHKEGKFAMLKRYCILKNIVKSLGDNVSIHSNVYLISPQNLEIGNNVSIHPLCYLDAQGGISIGNDVSIAHGVTIMSTSHTYNDKEIPIKYQTIEEREVVIEDNVWIGAKATILYGHKIESGSIVGANCLVTKDVKKNEIVGGVPNKLIKNRSHYIT